MTTFPYDPALHSLGHLREVREAGRLPHCPICSAPLELVLSLDEARRVGAAPGARCPSDRRHVDVHFHFESSVLWRQLEARSGSGG